MHLHWNWQVVACCSGTVWINTSSTAGCWAGWMQQVSEDANPAIPRLAENDEERKNMLMGTDDQIAWHTYVSKTHCVESLGCLWVRCYQEKYCFALSFLLLISLIADCLLYIAWQQTVYCILYFQIPDVSMPQEERRANFSGLSHSLSKRSANPRLFIIRMRLL